MARAGKTEEGRFIGIDLGKRTHEDAFVSKDGRVVFSNGMNTPDGRQALYKKLRRADTIGIEAGNLAFIFAREMKAAVGCKVLVLNPGSLAVIYKSLKKTDKEDSLKLARLVMRMPEEELPVVAQPSEEEMERRETISERQEAVHERTRYINELHALFLKAGITTIVRKDLATEERRQEAVKVLEGRLQARAKALLEMLGCIEDEIARIGALIKADAEGDAEIERVESVPGVGLMTAYAFTAYVKAERFERGAQVANYLGLVPSIDFSCTIKKTGHITKRGNSHVRSLLNQASWALVRSKKGGAIKGWYEEKTREGKNKKKAIVGVSRKLAGLMFTLLKQESKYEERKFIAPKVKAEKVKNLAAEALAA
jgi:transposase